MGAFLLFLLIFFIVIPLAKAFWAIYRQMRQVRSFMNDPAGYYSRTAGKQKKRKQEPQKQTHRKVFTKDMGEYVDFEEIRSDSPQQNVSSDEVKYKKEEQVTDIKWEDL